jgi:hypothetical protein
MTKTNWQMTLFDLFSQQWLDRTYGPLFFPAKLQVAQLICAQTLCGN